MNVILTGMRGTGKSNIGRALADLMGYAFVDTDDAIEEVANCRIAEIVARDGWGRFRSLEGDIVVRVAAQDKQVVATGGGTLIDPHNAALLKDRGVVVLFVCDVPTLQRRIAVETNRPSLTGEASAVEELEQVWQSRCTAYHAVADLVYDVSKETLDFELDVQRKAAAIHVLLQQHMEANA
jgi:shikimate kinase